MASMLLRESTNKRCQQQQQQQQQQGREQLARTAAGARLGVPEGPVVFSFATPSCVSLDLARRCQPWVDSIVHADDAIPRLSTVSLELLKEDLTGEFRRLRKDREHECIPHPHHCCAYPVVRLIDGPSR